MTNNVHITLLLLKRRFYCRDIFAAKETVDDQYRLLTVQTTKRRYYTDYIRISVQDK